MNVTETVDRRRRWATAGLIVALTAGIFSAPAAIFPELAGSEASAAIPAPTGLTQDTAAGSCWEIKQNVPASQDGLYWLLTPALKAPQQFQCDMTTDGGGWVLVGRGREGWKGWYQGLRPDRVNTAVSGTAAFQPAQLPSLTIDALLNNGRVDALVDGIRVRRAATADGSSWQEARFKMPKRDRWVWSFGAEHPVGTFSFDGAGGSGGQTNNFGSDNSFRRVNTQEPQAQGYLWGWAYGAQVTGTNSATTYLWSNTNNGGSARPFAQVWLRPTLKLADMDFGVVPDTGTAKYEQRPLANSDAMRTVWGAVGTKNGDTGELSTEVAAFGQVGNTVFVGGNFATLQRSATSTGSDLVDQSYLAGFDVNTGELVTSFRPTLNGQVKAIAALPDGRLIVGGQFTMVNGVAQKNIVVLDPATGTTSTGWQIGVENRIAGGVSQVRGFSINGNYLYVSGAFTHIVRSGVSDGSSWNGGRVALDTGRPDTNWNPALNGTSVGVDASDSGDRAYFSGYFRQAGATFQPSVAPLSSAPGAALAVEWTPTFSSAGSSNNYQGNIWQFGVAEAGSRLWYGGSEHMLFSYDRSSLARLSGNITKNGGDYQAIHVDESTNTLYAGCHCGDWVYSEAYSWREVGTNWTQADKINLVAAWDTQTGNINPEFGPILQARRGFGLWAAFTDSTGTQWMGGDFVSSIRAGYVNQWSAGFVRFAPRDSVAPSTPSALTATQVDATTARLDWGTSTDSAGAVSYEVLKDNKVIEATTSRSKIVSYEPDPTRYFVRAVDAAGNRSASTPVLVVTAPPPGPEKFNFVQSGSAWKWRFDSLAVSSQWRDSDFDDSSWGTGNAFLGLNTAGLGTDISLGAPSPRPITAYFRSTFQVENPNVVTNGQVSVVANDGVVVYVNGVEVGRSNMPSGTIGQNTYASAAPRSAAAAAARVTFSVPSIVLKPGANVVSAETHANYRATPDLSFDLSFVAEKGTPTNPPAPVAPAVVAAASTPSSVDVSWTPQDATVVANYVVSRNGVQVANPSAATTNFADTGLTPSTSYLYEVKAVDQFGQQSPAGSATATTPADTTMIADGSSWKWRFSSNALEANWNQIAFDDTSWSSGSAVLGLGTTGLGTNIGAEAPSPRPLSANFRHAFTVADPSLIGGAQLSVIANDGVAVYVNGTEVGRANLPTGTLTQSTYANAAPRAAAAAASRVTFTVPASLLVQGTNVVAAEVHANYRSTPDLTFDLSLTRTDAPAVAQQTIVQAPDSAPDAPTVAATSEDNQVLLTWTAPPVEDLDGFVVLRDGIQIGTTDEATQKFTDQKAGTGEHSYEVRAVDDLDQQSQPGAVSVATG